MLDFASALYLDMRHDDLSPTVGWPLTLGRPAALEEPPGAASVGAALASLQGCEKALMMTSTLHVFWDLFEMLSRTPSAMLVDGCTYPVSRWAMSRMAGCGCQVSGFGHHNFGRLKALTASAIAGGRRPVLVTDGYCGACGRSPPIREYVALADAVDGLLVVDDTQGLGVLGSGPVPSMPYGRGGGGALRWHGVSGPRIIVGASLAKAFGAPLAVISGGESLIGQYRDASRTRVHCSPPSAAAIRAAQAALRMNDQRGDALRRSLLERVKLLREAMARAGLRACSAFPFPMQHFDVPPHVDAPALCRRLFERNVWSVPTRSGRGGRLTFLVSVRHSPREIEKAGRIVADVLSTHVMLGRKENRDEQAFI